MTGKYWLGEGGAGRRWKGGGGREKRECSNRQREMKERQRKLTFGCLLKGEFSGSNSDCVKKEVVKETGQPREDKKGGEVNNNVSAFLLAVSRDRG